MPAVPVGRYVTGSDASKAGRSSGSPVDYLSPSRRMPREEVGCCLVLGAMLDRATVFFLRFGFLSRNYHRAEEGTSEYQNRQVPEPTGQMQDMDHLADMTNGDTVRVSRPKASCQAGR